MAPRHISLAALIGWALLGTGCEDPGVGKLADQGRAKGAVLIRALDAFHRDAAKYPEQLGDLAPKYLSKDKLSALTSKPTEFDYSSYSPGSYELMFTYTGPGINNCTHRPEDVEPAWVCGGHY
jgi:hypothetical protein